MVLSDGTKIAIEIVVSVVIVAGVISMLTLHRNWKLNSVFLSRVFFWFGIVCGLFGVFTQYGLSYQVENQNLFGDSTFYLLLGSLSTLAGIYWNTDKTNSIL